MEKRPFFRAATAGLGKYHTGGYGRIGVYRVNEEISSHFLAYEKVMANKLELRLPIISGMKLFQT